MARKRTEKPATNAKSPKQGAVETIWANCRLTGDDAPYILEESKDLPALATRLAAVFVIGADFSIRFNPIRGNYSAFIIAPIDDNASSRTGISAFGPDLPTTLSAILYKFDLFQQSPERFDASAQSMGFG